MEEDSTPLSTEDFLDRIAQGAPLIRAGKITTEQLAKDIGDSYFPTTWSIADVSVTLGSMNTGPSFVASHASTTATITGTTYSAPVSRGHIYRVRSTQPGFQLVATQNSWRANHPTALRYSFSTSTDLSYTSDDNVFQTECSFSIAGTEYSSVAAYKTGTGQDANSIGP